MSTIDKKKTLSSPKHSIKVHQNELTDDNNREIKNSPEIPLEDVFYKNYLNKNRYMIVVCSLGSYS